MSIWHISVAFFLPFPEYQERRVDYEQTKHLHYEEPFVTAILQQNFPSRKMLIWYARNGLCAGVFIERPEEITRHSLYRFRRRTDLSRIDRTCIFMPHTVYFSVGTGSGSGNCWTGCTPSPSRWRARITKTQTLPEKPIFDFLQMI